MLACTFWLTACHSWGTAHAATGIYIAYACCDPTRPARPHTPPHPPHCPLQLPLPPPPSHLPERIVKVIFIFMAWLCFTARAQRVSALYLPHSTFLVSWQQFSCPFPLPLLLLLCLCCRLLCLPLNCLLAFLQNTCACVCDFCFVSLQFPLPHPLFGCFTVFAAGQLNCLAFHSFSLFFFFCPPLSLCLFSTIFTLLAKRFSHWLCIFWVSKCLRFNLSI